MKKLACLMLVLVMMLGAMALAETNEADDAVVAAQLLEDVKGFIENGGRNCLSCGCWKVYSNECEALKAFERYEKCKAVYQRLFASGCPLTRLTVAARPA